MNAIFHGVVNSFFMQKRLRAMPTTLAVMPVNAPRMAFETLSATYWKHCAVRICFFVFRKPINTMMAAPMSATMLPRSTVFIRSPPKKCPRPA